MAKFKGAVKQCVVCSASFKVPACRAEKAICCSRKCKDAWWSEQRVRLDITCKGCGEIFKIHPCHSSRRVYCSMKCKSIHGVNPIGGFGEENLYWKGGRVQHADGYIYLYSSNHPFAKNINYVFEHRLVVEQWLRKNDPESKFLIVINGERYLSREFVVHHKNGDKADNSIDNLQCMTQSEHMRHHQNDAEYLRKQIATLQARLKILA